MWIRLVDDIPRGGRKAGSVKTASDVQPLLGAKNIPIKPRETCETNMILVATLGTIPVLYQNSALCTSTGLCAVVRVSRPVCFILSNQSRDKWE